jgi:DNA-binding beta-propeller fold protein YncE
MSMAEFESLQRTRRHASFCRLPRVLAASILGCLLLPAFSGSPITPLTDPPGATTPPLRKVADIPLPGPPARFDYQSLDLKNQRLYIAHMNADQLVVFDIAGRRVVANLDGFARVHGVLAVPEQGRVYASVTGDHQVAVVDMKTLRIVSRVGPIDYPDGLAYAPGPQRVFVSDEHGKADAVMDARTNRLTARIPLGGEAGNTVYDPDSRRIFVAVHESNELVAIDPETESIVGRYPTTGVKRPHGIALDPALRLAFVAGEGNSALAVIDLATMKVLGVHPVGKDPDVLAFDAGSRRLYVASESGAVWVFRERERKLFPEGNLFMPHAHSVCVDPDTHLVYFPLESIDGRPLLRIMGASSVESGRTAD